MIFKKKDEKEHKSVFDLDLMLGMKVCVARYNDRKNQDEAELGYIIARRRYYRLRTPYDEGGMYWAYLVKFSDGSTDVYKEDDIYLDYDRRLENEN